MEGAIPRAPAAALARLRVKMDVKTRYCLGASWQMAIFPAPLIREGRQQGRHHAMQAGTMQTRDGIWTLGS